MLRKFFLLLVLINSTYFAWSQGLLTPLGLAPARQIEPQRLNQQIRPQELRVISAQDLSRHQGAASSAPTTTE